MSMSATVKALIVKYGLPDALGLFAGELFGAAGAAAAVVVTAVADAQELTLAGLVGQTAKIIDATINGVSVASLSAAGRWTAAGLDGIGGTHAGSLKANATVRASWNDTGLGLYAAAPVAQAARVGQLTDNSGGAAADGTIAVIAGTVGDATAATVVSTADAIKELATKINAIETALHNLGATQ